MFAEMRRPPQSVAFVAQTHWVVGLVATASIALLHSLTRRLPGIEFSPHTYEIAGTLAALYLLTGTLVWFDPERDHWMALARLRFVPHDDDLDRRETRRRMREYRRRLRGWLYRGEQAVAIEGIVEYKHWLYESLMDINVLMWRGHDRAEVAALAQRELASLRDYLAAKDAVLSDDGSVRVASLVSVAADADESLEDTRMRVCRVLGQLLAAEEERPLSALDAFAADEQTNEQANHECAGGDPVAPGADGSRNSQQSPEGALP